MVKNVVLTYVLMGSIGENVFKKNTFFIVTLKKILFIIFIFLFLYLNIFVKNIFADAWTQTKKHGIIIGSIESKQFSGIDSIGIFDKKKNIHQTLLNIYGEYGISNKITLGAKIIAVDSMQMKNKAIFGKIDKRSYALDTAQIFTRIRIIKNDWFVLSFAAQIGAPSLYKKSDVSYFSIQKWNYEPRIEIGVNIGKYDFFTLTAGYHRNIKHFYDEGRFELTYGHYIESILFMIKLQKYIYVITNNDVLNKAYYNMSSIVSIYDYLTKTGFAKLNLSFLFPIDKNLKLEIGGYSSLKTKLLFTQKLDLDLKGIYISIFYTF